MGIVRKRTKGLITTIAAVILCGCPGLFLCGFGAMAVAGTPITTGGNGLSDPVPLQPTAGLAILGTGAIFLLIPIVVGLVTLRKSAAPTDMSGPLPPPA